MENYVMSPFQYSKLGVGAANHRGRLIYKSTAVRYRPTANGLSKPLNYRTFKAQSH